MNEYPTTYKTSQAVEASRTVLVVEDEPAIRGLLTEFLRGEGFQVEVARDGQEALRLLADSKRRQRPCVVLLDVMLPQVDGVTMLRQLSTKGPRVPVVAMSASYDALSAAVAAGARAALPKPFDLDRLLLTLERQTAATA